MSYDPGMSSDHPGVDIDPGMSHDPGMSQDPGMSYDPGTSHDPGSFDGGTSGHDPGQ
jgi:hypothetical protein